MSFSLEGFTKETVTNQTASSVSMVAGTKLILTGEAIERLELTPEQMGKSSRYRATLHTNAADMQLVIAKDQTTDGVSFSGKAKRVELYAAPVCKKVLGIIGKTLAGSGTVNFSGVDYDTSPDGIPYIIIDLTSYSANQGVFKNDTVNQVNLGKED